MAGIIVWDDALLKRIERLEMELRAIVASQDARRLARQVGASYGLPIWAQQI